MRNDASLIFRGRRPKEGNLWELTSDERMIYAQIKWNHSFAKTPFFSPFFEGKRIIGWRVGNPFWMIEKTRNLHRSTN